MRRIEMRRTMLTPLAVLALLLIAAGTDYGGQSPNRQWVQWIPAADMHPDTDGAGSQCIAIVATQYNSGPILTTVQCDDSAAADVYFDFAGPSTYTGGDLTAEVDWFNINAAPTGNWGYS